MRRCLALCPEVLSDRPDLSLDQGWAVSNRVGPVRVEQEGTNIVHRTKAAREIATSPLHGPLLYESCCIHLRKRVRSPPRALGLNRVYSLAVAQTPP